MVIYKFLTNGNFDSWVLYSKPRTVQQYVDWISEFADYCHREGLNIHDDGQSVKLFLVVYRHDTPKVAKRSNKRQKVSRGKILSRRLESSTVFFQLSSITQSVRAAVPPVSADSRAFAVPSVHNIGSCTWIYGRWHSFTCLVRCLKFWSILFVYLSCNSV